MPQDNMMMTLLVGGTYQKFFGFLQRQVRRQRGHLALVDSRQGFESPRPAEEPAGQLQGRRQVHVPAQLRRT